MVGTLVMVAGAVFLSHAYKINRIDLEGNRYFHSSLKKVRVSGPCGRVFTISPALLPVDPAARYAQPQSSTVLAL